MPRGFHTTILSTTLGSLLAAAPLAAHPGDVPHAGHDEPVLLALADEKPATPAPAAVPGVTGQGKYRFRLLYGRDHLPEPAVQVLTRAHGGFAVDRRKDKGDIYFALPGAGIVRISGDLKTTAMVDTPAPVRDNNQHNTLLWYAPDGRPFLTFPANDAGKVFTLTLDGKLLHTLDAPTPEDDLGNPTATDYFRQKLKFTPTDVEQLDGLYYIPTGYSTLDYVLTARITLEPFSAKWNALSFGGKGGEPGQFGTGHGVTIPQGVKRVDIADRPNSEIDRFSPDGRYLETVTLPKGSWPCDVWYEGKIAVVGCLHGPDRSKGAPIYILEDDKVVSTLMPKEDLGLDRFTHVHNAIGVTRNGKLYVIAQAWNPGDFAILEQIVD